MPPARRSSPDPQNSCREPELLILLHRRSGFKKGSKGTTLKERKQLSNPDALFADLCPIPCRRDLAFVLCTLFLNQDKALSSSPGLHTGTDCFQKSIFKFLVLYCDDVNEHVCLSVPVHAFTFCHFNTRSSVNLFNKGLILIND